MHRFMRAGALLTAGAVAGVAIVVSCHAGPSSSLAQSSGTTKFVTADTDSQQLRHGYVATQTCPSGGGVYAVLTSGPMILTDLSSASYAPTILLAPSTATDCSGVCGSAPQLSDQVWPPKSPPNYTDGPLTGSGLRVFIPAGSQACAALAGSPGVSWSGFAPY
jgi:hypothetical protein